MQLVLCHMDKLPELAEPKMYHSSGGGAGLASLLGEIRARLIEKDSHEAVQKRLLGGNIARRSAVLHES